MQGKLAGLFTVVLFFAATPPTSTNYTLKTYDFGNGGGTSSSATYSLHGEAGSQSGTAQSSATYGLQSDGKGVMNAAVPPAPTVTNPSNYYDRLKVVVATGGNPTDTKYLIAVSTDGFVTSKYVQTDNSMGVSQAIANYQTYTAWGGASGFTLVGLAPSTTYQVRVKALQGSFSGSAFGPSASAATVAPSLTVSLATTLTGTPPFSVGFSNMTAGSVATGNADALIGITTNAVNGGSVYVKDANAGLYSTLANTTIGSNSADLTVASTGYGAQIIASSQVSGGPIVSQSPFNGASNNVGALSTAYQTLFTSAAPVTTGSATMRLKAKVATLTPSATDYADVITLVAAMNH